MPDHSAASIRKAKAAAQKLYDVAVRNVVVQDDVVTEDEDESEEEPEDDE